VRVTLLAQRSGPGEWGAFSPCGGGCGAAIGDCHIRCFYLCFSEIPHLYYCMSI